VAQLGGEPLPAIGWAMGQERVVALMQQAQPHAAGPAPHVYMVLVGERAENAGLAFAERMRDAHPRLRVQLNLGGGNFKTQFRRADKSGAEVALILGDSEVERGVIAVKPLRAEGEQRDVASAELTARLGEWLQEID
jgi:histidyl-tRNA synthetase